MVFRKVHFWDLSFLIYITDLSMNIITVIQSTLDVNDSITENITKLSVIKHVPLNRVPLNRGCYK